MFGKAPQVLDYSNCLGLRLEYELPRQIGADRLANVLGAHALGHKQGVVIDLGTATTYDVFGEDAYFGGIICPGIQSSLRSLAQTAAKLSEVELRWIDKAIGKTTDDALRIGMLQGTLGQVEYLLKAIFAEKSMRNPLRDRHGRTGALVGRANQGHPLRGTGSDADRHQSPAWIARKKRKEDKMKRILVTGGAGFLGSHLCERLVEQGPRRGLPGQLFHRQQAQCRASARPRQFRAHPPRCDHAPVPGSGSDLQPRLPGFSHPLPVQSGKTIKTSVMGAINMLGLAKRVKARILQASTSEVYGDPEVHPQKEDYWGHVNPIGIRSCYDEGKRVAETLFFDYKRQNKVDIRIIRIFNTYGPKMHPHDGRVVSNFIVQALQGKDITIYGDGSQTRSFCYVSDLVDGMMRLMEHATLVGPVNVGNPERVHHPGTGRTGDRPDREQKQNRRQATSQR